MELKYLGEDKTSSRRSDFRSVPSVQKVRTTQKNAKNNLLEAIAQVQGGGLGVSQCEEDGVVRMKLVLTKQQLKHMMLLMEKHDKISDAHRSPAASMMSSAVLEQRIRGMMQKRQLRRSEQLRRGRGTWRPVLQSIPEEAL
ncbi:hypothetical protein H6P81_018718 [Aristolochia fimbriata]|uniref:Uncharacterized protein n=1 Tax=Aristolochia fimbriata TaxID=158543 RepID=A0AAV7E238_ARIFI|nr:hypothetical protein H6P81_018718 [Aristolochia fimbriata]